MGTRPVLPAVSEAILWNSQQWVEYFHSNAKHLIPVFWDPLDILSPEECERISASIRIFQLGESSDGKRLIHAAEIDASRTQDPSFVEAMRLFIGEEQRHAATLARFMEHQKIPLRRHQWTDTAFRFLRRLWNLEICVTVLMTAELVAKVYYRALRNATHSPSLRQICRQLLQDEAFHVSFHASILGRIRSRRPAFMNSICNLAYMIFHATTLLIVWSGHVRVFRAGGFSFIRYCKVSIMILRQAFQSIQTAGNRPLCTPSQSPASIRARRTHASAQ